jgi:preprotein translocase subunit SecD
MAKRSVSFWPVVSVIATVLVVIVALPQEWKNGWAPGFLNPGFHLGLDLAGGTQLDFRISENEIQQQLNDVDAQIKELEANDGAADRIAQLQNERLIVEEQQRNLVEAIRTVLERRINSLGVSEATITPSYIGGEKHLLVECPGVVDVQQCIATVGKTIQLEFKEEFTEATQAYESEVRGRADAALRRITASGISLAVIGQDMGDSLGMGYEESRWMFKDELPIGAEAVWNKTPEDGVFKTDGTIIVQGQDAQGQVVPQDIPGVFLMEVLSGRTMTGRVIQEASIAFGVLAQSGTGMTQNSETDVELDKLQSARLIGALRAMQTGELKVAAMEDGSAKVIFLRAFTPGQEQVDVSHVLVAYKGATSAPGTVTRTKEEALAKIQDLKKQIDAGASLEQLARTQSDGPSAQNGGKLANVARGQLVPSFEQAAFSQKAGIVSEPVETPFGYHLIRVDKEAYKTSDKANYDELTVAGANAENRANDLLAKLQAGEVTKQEEAMQLRSLFFSLRPTGWKDTALDGKHFRSASVTLDPTTNVPIVQIVFDTEGGRLFQELTRNNIGKRIAIFVGGELVSAPTVQGEIIGGTAVITGSTNIEEARLLAQDLNTGAIPAPIYLSGQRTVEATLGNEALQTSIVAGFFGMLVVMLYMLLVYRFLGLIANISLAIYALIFLAILKLPLFLFTDQYIVLTLAGAAGLILSIGMAVDTNVLVFERVKEELRKGKMLKTAVEIGFDKAWSSIRDSNISTIITCALLFMIGTSIVRGFAVTLGMGVIISMFTGMIITKWMCRKIADTPVANNPGMFPGMKKNTDQASSF